MSTFPSLDAIPVASSLPPSASENVVNTREIVDVDLHFLRKVRGLQAISRFSAQDDGSSLISFADTMEARVFHIACATENGMSPPLTTYSVETLRKIEIALPEGATEPALPRFIGISDDALYGFHGSRKSRFLSDRRAGFADVSLAQTGPHFAVLFSDMLASGWAVALGTLSQGSGRLLWTKDIGFSATRVAIDRTGSWTAVAGSDGDVHVFGNGRDLVVRSVQNMRVTALATNGPSLTLVAGSTSSGPEAPSGDDSPCLVAALNDDGSVRWHIRLQGVPVEVGCDTSGAVTAVLLRLEGNLGKLVLLGQHGLPSAEVELSATPLGLSVSPSGAYITVSLRDGTLATYAPRFGSRMAEADGTDVVERAQEMARRLQYTEAVAALQARLSASPADTSAHDALMTILDAWRAGTLDTVQHHVASGDWETADRCLQSFLQHLGPRWFDEAVLSARRDLRTLWADTEMRLGQDALLQGDTDAAERHLQEAIDALPSHREARALLAAAQTANRLRLERDGQAHLRRGEFAKASLLLRQARQLGTNRPEIARMLREAQIGEALAEGNRLYQERQYDAAVFHFKKVLRLAPDHAEARQRLGYAESMVQPSTTSDRFRRLE